MSLLPVPLPGEAIPPGARDWRSADAERWRALAEPRWSHPVLPIAAMVVGFVLLVAFSPSSPEDVCTTSSPCDADWWGLAPWVVLLVTPYCLWRLPRLALPCLAVLVVITLTDAESDGVLTRPSAYPWFAAIGYAAATALHRLSVAARQRRCAREAAGEARFPVPEATRWRERPSFVATGVLLAVAAFGYWMASDEISTYENHAANGRQIAATVVRITGGEDDDAAELTVKSEEGVVHRVESWYPEDFPVGSAVDLVVDGDYVRLVAEPYDVEGWQVLVMAALAAAAVFLANGVTGRASSTRLHTEPQPVLKVLVRRDRKDFRTRVYAADDPAGERPVLSLFTVPAAEDGEEEPEDEKYEDAAEDERDEEAWERLALTAPREAVLYGSPHADGELVLVTAAAPGIALVETGATPVRPAVPKLQDALRAHLPGGPRGRGDARRARRNRYPRRTEEEIVAGMVTGPDPVSYAADTRSRLVGGFLLLAQAGGIWILLRDGFSWPSVLLIIALPFTLRDASLALNWRITADQQGVWVTGAWRTRRIPWDRLHRVRAEAEGIRIKVVGGSEHTLPGRRPAALRAEEELNVLRGRPELRPGRDAGPGEQGMPVGPVIVVVAVLWAVAVLLLF
ncbi:hypothetical protein [Streptomyces paludis]|uniref:Uncharacterized protein n=1 Tax=Streptomyces paludis TaxID=2282738 RepID=A0A345HXN5_9ACTN|nr:hypothetical protein [Streptomyces paludis]AXG81459.1 hypothetical protein DVK44_31355 [Streptomyces paludis]